MDSTNTGKYLYYASLITSIIQPLIFDQLLLHLAQFLRCVMSSLAAVSVINAGVCVAAAFFMEHWKRRQMRLNYEWDLTGFEDEEV